MTGETFLKILIALSVLILFSAFTKCSSAKKNLKSIPCTEDTSLILTVEKEFVELSFRDVYNLAYKNSNGKTRIITGNIHILPEAKRYRDLIIINDFHPERTKSLFDYHYLSPSEFTREEFDEICLCYKQNRDSLPELETKIGALVYGDFNSFREIFKLPDGFYIVTEHDGNLTILTDPSIIAMTYLPEKKHFNNIGYFDDQNRIHLRKGKIISGEFIGFYGKPVKKVEFISESGKADYTGEVEILWCDLLYSSGKTGVNSNYILSAVNSKGERLDKVFHIEKNNLQK
ncbi:MAG TPA: hypothetical protein P5120_13635 [Spirochaetota bacterium]|nr:hypothetical protein [Spirochaetota bacterium]